MKPIPTLSGLGFITDPPQGMVELYKLFCVSEVSQSNLFAVQSFPNILRYGSIQDGQFSRMMRDALSTLYTAYYESAEVDVRTLENPDTARYDIAISITVRDDNREYRLNQAISDVAERGDVTIDRLLAGLPL